MSKILLIMSKILLILLILIILLIRWFISGVNLNYLQNNAINKATEICGENNKIIKQGYQRSLLNGFGGRVWFQCKLDGLWYTFYISQRINNNQFQVYNFEPVIKFPATFKIN
jgi:energy-coupling factor transporter transmembrane protein EcfT